MKNIFKKIPATAQIYMMSAFLMGISVCLIASPIWSTRRDYFFGYLAPIFVLYILYDRAGKILSFFSENSKLNLSDKLSRYFKILCDFSFGTMLVFGMITYIFFAYAYFFAKNVSPFGMTIGFVFAAFAMSYFSSAKDCLGKNKNIYERFNFVSLFIFPCFIWLIAVPLFGRLESFVSINLLSIVANITYSVMDSLGFIVTLRGNALEFPNGNVGVEDACSGIRSLTACLFAGSFFAAAMLNKFWKKILLVILSMCFAFFFNVLRAMFLAFWAYENGSDSISGFVHDAAGYFVLGMTAIGLLIFVSLLNMNPIPKEFRAENKK